MKNDPVGARRINIRGIVQGVGFRPFVYTLADKYALTGWVRNTTAGVEISVDGLENNLDNFVRELRLNPPSLAKIDHFQVKNEAIHSYTKFEIISSQDEGTQFIPVSPDVSICPDCLQELFDPADRRYRYPYINCTKCGPRFSIIKKIPYDRPNTTMSGFVMCPDCLREYDDPLNRRFHAQPIACPQCGPQVWFEIHGKSVSKGEDAIQQTRQWLSEGKIIALKGLGGFHLACDATNESAVKLLRERKRRIEKPFAVMTFDIETAKRYCQLNQDEIAVLTSKERPIILCQQKPESGLARSIAPQLDTVGIMLPYTPLHYLLMEPAEGYPGVLVMTSGNMSEEPIAYNNEQAREQLGRLADAFLFHNREIQTRLDDSLVEVNAKRIYHIRRSRGYAPLPLVLPLELPQILATGAELKNTFCLTRDNYAFVSHHIGDMENLETTTAYENAIAHYQDIFRIQPEMITCDMHPDYFATRYAEERSKQESLPLVKVQHHHAHLAACLAENGWTSDESVLGVCLDGTGYGTDGAIWGGEFLLGNYIGYKRLYHLRYIPLPGGDQATRFPYRTALAHLWSAGFPWENDLPPVFQCTSEQLKILEKQLQSNINCLPTSSMGRLFDAVASLTGIRQQVNYEAQAAIEMEALIEPNENGKYLINFRDGIIETASILKAIIADLHNQIPLSTISARFHNSIAQLVVDISTQVRDDLGCNSIALSGGVWQNRYLLEDTRKNLLSRGFNVMLHSQIPTNDGGISLGQAMIAAHTRHVLKEG